MNNIDPEKMNNIKNLVDNGNISDAISQISPEMIQNFSKMFNSNNQNTSNSGHSNETNSNNNNNSNFDFSKIDPSTLLKMKSIMENMNNKKDPRSNLLYSLKPYLRQNRQDKLDQYVNLLNISQIADLLKNDKKDDKNV